MRPVQTIAAVLLPLVVLGLALPARAQHRLPKTLTYAKDIKPIVDAQCLSCHQPHDHAIPGRFGKNPAGGLDFSDPMKAFGPTSRIVKRGKPDDSVLIWALEATHGVDLMPKGGEAMVQHPLTKAQIKLFRDWIKLGAELK